MSLTEKQLQRNRNYAALGGRPKGSITAERKLFLKTQAAINKRIDKLADKLINSQVVSALGSHKIIVMTRGEDGKMNVETVRDETRMNDLLETGVYGTDYLIVAGALPDWKAGNALLDRRYGKAKESLKVDVDVKFSLKDLADSRKALVENIDNQTDNAPPKIIDIDVEQ